MRARLGLMACVAAAVAAGVGGCQAPLAPADQAAVPEPVRRPSSTPLHDAARDASRALRVAGGVALDPRAGPDGGAGALGWADSTARDALRRLRALRGARGRQERARRAMVARLEALVDDLAAARRLAEAGVDDRLLRTIGIGLQPEIRRIERLRSRL